MKNAAKRIFSCKNRNRYSRKRATFCRNFANRRSLTSPPRRPLRLRGHRFCACGWHLARRGPARGAQTPLRGGDVRERRLAKFRQNVARFRLYRLRFLQENMRFAAFFKIYQILKLKFLKFDKFFSNFATFAIFLLKFHENCCFFKPIFLRKF